ncbi:MAG: hypothetical protein PHD97_08810 [Bacteroidales bacterium]|nr:hypothetical protein [Bacteroidales bacterium]
MKKVIVLLLMTGSSLIVFSQVTQTDTVKKHDNTLNIDITYLMSQFFNFNNSQVTLDPYMLIYKRHFKNNLALRVGASVYQNEINEKGNVFDSTHTSYSTTVTRDTTGGNFVGLSYTCGIGLEKQIKLYKKWSFEFGFDIFGTAFRDKSSTYSSSRNDRYDDFNYSVGIAPLASLIFNINSFVSISTSTYLQIAYQELSSKIYYDMHGSSYSSGKHLGKYTDKGYFINYIYPLSLKVNIRF